MGVPYVLFVATNAAVIGPNKRHTGFFFPEIAHPFEALDKAGIAVEFASPLGGKPPEDGFDGDDSAQTSFRDSQAYRRLSRSRKLSEVDVLDYDAVFFPGGLGPMVDITGNPEVQEVVLRAWNAGRIVSAVCHGPSAFLGVTLDDGTPFVQGRKLTSFSTAEEDGYAHDDVPFDLETALRAEGALFEATDPWQSRLVVDGRLITGQNPQSGGVVGEALAEALGEVGLMGSAVVVVARWETTPSTLGDVLAHIAELGPLSLAESGCLGYEVLESVDEPTVLVLIERYRDSTALDEHRNSSHYQDLVVGRILPLLTGRRVEILREPGVSAAKTGDG